MQEIVILAGGCFWCIEEAFSHIPGVLMARSGYTGGSKANPTYEEVCQGTTGHMEAVELIFDSQKITLSEILDIFWRHIDPLDVGGQFYDRGSQYQTAIFYFNERQKKIIETSKEKIAHLLEAPIATKILPAQRFYPAEEHHQQYWCKQPLPYQQYRKGHEKRLKELWDSLPSKEELRRTLRARKGITSRFELCETKPNRSEPGSCPNEEHSQIGKGDEEDRLGEVAASPNRKAIPLRALTPLQYKVTQEEGTEPPFANEYWDNKEEGLYVDRVTGEPLFSSRDKFESGTGWPSFTKPLDPSKIEEREDYKLGVLRVEVRSRKGNCHLGHRFPDGPKPTGQRYCLNSAALRFIPKEKLKEEGYGDYLSLFD